MPPSARAQLSEAPIPDLTTLMQEVVASQRTAEAAQQEYLVHEQLDIIQNLEHCYPSCPGFPYRSTAKPKESGLLVTDYEKRESEVFWLDGVRVSRLLSSANNPRYGAGSSHILSPEELKQENDALGEMVKKVLEVRANRDPGQELKLAGVLNELRISRLLELGAFSNPRREVHEHRNSILVDYQGSRCLQSCDQLDSAAQWISGTLTIDEEDHTAVSFHGNFDQSWKFPGDPPLRIPEDAEDAEVSFSAQRVADRLWFPETISISFDLSKHKRSLYDGETRWRAETICLQYTGYDKFRVASTVRFK
jgi:hypothetical protein